MCTIDMRRILGTASAVALLAVARPLVGLAPALAQQPVGPAVSSPNGKISVFGGGDEDGGIIYGAASYTMPLGHSFGLQIDGLAGDAGATDDGIFQGAAHLFWRDPSKGLLGLYGSALSADPGEMYRIAGEGHLYLNRITLEGLVGWDQADTDDGTFWSATAAYYLTGNTRVFGGARYSDWRDGLIEAPGTVGFAGLEHQLNWGSDRRGYSVFAEGRFGDDYNAAWGGLRVYFGANKSLIRRHREDDPGTQVPDLLDIVEVIPPPAAPPPPMGD